MSIADELRKLQELQASGALTGEEFASAKALVLGSVSVPTPPVHSDGEIESVRERLDQLKSKLRGISSFREIPQALERAEDLLILVCGENRYRDLLESGQKVAYMREAATNSGDWREAKAIKKVMRDEYDSLMRRLGGIEYHPR